MSAVVKDIFMEQGATFDWFFRLTYSDDSPVPLTDWACRMQVRSRQQQAVQVQADTSDDSIKFGVDPADFDVTSASPDPTNGWVWIRFGADDTSLINVKTGAYDVELYDPDDDTVVYRLWTGTTTDDPNITQDTGEPVLT